MSGGDPIVAFIALNSSEVSERVERDGPLSLDDLHKGARSSLACDLGRELEVPDGMSLRVFRSLHPQEREHATAVVMHGASGLAWLLMLHVPDYSEDESDLTLKAVEGPLDMPIAIERMKQLFAIEMQGVKKVLDGALDDLDLCAAEARAQALKAKGAPGV